MTHLSQQFRDGLTLPAFSSLGQVWGRFLVASR